MYHHSFLGFTTPQGSCVGHADNNMLASSLRGVGLAALISVATAYSVSPSPARPVSNTAAAYVSYQVVTASNCVTRRSLATWAIVAASAWPRIVHAAAPTSFDLIKETSAPYSQHYAENAAQLAAHLDYYVITVDEQVGRQLKGEIIAFSSQYRRDGYTPYGIMPGLPALQTAYGALSAHFTRYQSTPTGFATPLPDALVSTVRRNVGDAQKALARAAKLAEAADDDK